MKKYFVSLVIIILCSKTLLTMFNTQHCEEAPVATAIEKNWQKLYKTHKNELTDPFIAGKQFAHTAQNFLFGISSSAYQIEGGLDDNNAIAAFYQSKGLPTAVDAIDFWHRYKDDIKQMKEELGINSFRLSIAWDRVEPMQGAYDQNAIDTYIDIIKTLKQYDIEPVVTLHHYTIPTWFAQIGGFEYSNNNHHFVSFAKKMYLELCHDVIYWSTFNAPEAYALKGYAKGDAAPGYTGKWQLVEQVLLNMLNAHVDIYQSIKGLNGLYYSLSTEDNAIPLPRIGIQKNIVLLDSSTDNALHWCLSPISALCCMTGNMLQSKGFYSFFATRTFEIHVPFLVNITYSNPLASSSLDWIGLNFYSNVNLFITSPQRETISSKTTENPTYRDYPEGIARAIKELYTEIAQPLNIPIMITENGIATSKQESKKREKFFQRTLFTIKTLIDDGYPIIGYLPWSSHDSYEWPTQEF